MKKAILLISSLLFLSCYANAGRPKNDLQKENLQGKVESTSTSVWDFTELEGVVQKGYERFREECCFNKDGNRSRFSRGGDSYGGYGDGFHSYNYTYHYDAAGKLIEREKYYDSIWLPESRYMYDSYGNCIEVNYLKADGSPDYISTFKYDTTGNLIELSWYDSAGVFKSKYTYQYDRNGWETQQFHLNADSSKGYTNIYERDRFGNCLEEKWYDKEMLLWMQWSRKYDTHNNVTENKRHAVYGIGEVKTTYQYEYDTTGNWIKRKEYKNGVPNTFSERTIVYY